MTQKVCNDKTGSDKKLHALVTFAIGAVLAGLLSVFKFPTPALPAAITFIIAIAIGIAKECHDRKQKGNHFCIWDLLADAIGAVAQPCWHFSPITTHGTTPTETSSANTDTP